MSEQPEHLATTHRESELKVCEAADNTTANPLSPTSTPTYLVKDPYYGNRNSIRSLKKVGYRVQVAVRRRATPLRKEDAELVPTDKAITFPSTGCRAKAFTAQSQNPYP